MKILSKTMSVLLSCLMVLSLMPLAASADVLTKEQLAEKFSWSEDFENFTQQTVYDDWTIQLTGEGKTSYALNEGLYHDGDGSYISYDIVNGVFGKDDNDAALKFTSQVFGKDLTTDIYEQAYPVQFESSAEIRFYRSQEMEYSATSAAGLASYDDALVHYSTEFAVENLFKSSSYGTREIALSIDLYGNGDTDSSASLSTSNRSRFDVIRLIGVNETSPVTLKVFGETNSLTLKQKTWHKLDLVIGSDLGMDLYIDGVKINSEKVYKSGNAVAPLRGTGVFRWYSNNKKNNSSSGYPATPFYLDNTSATLLYNVPVIGSYNPAYDTTKVYADMENTEETNESYVPEAYLGNAVIADKGVMTFKGVDGVFGKNGKVFEMSNTSSPISGSCNPYLQFCKASYTVADNLIAGDKVRVAFSLANKSTPQSTRYLSIDGMDKPIQLQASGKAVFHGKEFNVDMRVGKWNNFEAVYTKGTSDFSAELYVNGLKACGPVSVSKTITSFANIRIGYEGAVLSSTDKTYKADGIYIDDVIFEKYAGGNYNSASITISNGSTVLSSADAQFKPGVNVTAGQLKSALTISNAASYKIVDNAGVEKNENDIAEDGYLVINSNDKRVVLYKLISEQPVEEFNFENTGISETVDKISFDLNFGKIHNESSKRGHSFTAIGGLCGKETEDISLVMSTTDFNTSTYGNSSRDPFIRYQFTERETESFYSEFSILMNGQFDNAYIQISTYQGDTNKGVVPFKFYPDGRITLKGTEGAIERWEENRWYRIGISADPSKDTIDVYLNGKKYTIPTGFDIANGNLAFANFRVSVEYPSNKTVSGMLALDDFVLYKGIEVAEGDALVTSNNANYFVNENVIYTKSSPTAASLENALNFDAASSVIYTDDTYTTVVSGDAVITDKSVMIVKSGYILDYYKIRKLDSNYAPVIYFDGRESSALKTGKVSAEVCTNLVGADGKLILAVYVGNRLDKIAVSDIPVGFAVTKTESLNLTGSLEGASVSAFALDSYDTMEPVTRAENK